MPASRAVKLKGGWIGSVWIAMCRGAGGRNEVGAPQVAAEKQIFWEDSGKYRTSGLDVGVGVGVGSGVARGPRGGPRWRVAACCDRFALEQVSAAIGVRGGEEHGEDRRGAAEGARSRGGESCRDIGPRIGGPALPALPALARRRGARARCGVEQVAEDGVHGDHESGCDGGHGREAVCARRARANRSGFGGGLGGGERV